MLKSYILHIDRNLGTEEYHTLLGRVSGEKRSRIQRFHRFEDSQRTLLGDILARYAICKKLNIDNKDLVFNKNPYGKPFIPGITGIHFNISHSENWVVCALDSVPIGIDVEVIKPIDFNIAQRFFSKFEYSSLLFQPSDLRLKYFYALWTLKESYIKAEGKGLSIPLDSFSIEVVNDFSDAAIVNGDNKYSFDLIVLNNAICSVCSSGNEVNQKINYELSSFLKETAFM